MNIKFTLGDTYNFFKKNFYVFSNNAKEITYKSKNSNMYVIFKK